jgi:DNA-directed RNA polymerase subunit E"
MRKKVCKQCRIFAEEGICPVCRGNDFATSWQGRVNVLNAEKSAIAKKMNVSVSGEYAIKVR